MSLSVFVLVVLSVVLASALGEHCGDEFYCYEGYCCGTFNDSCCSGLAVGKWGGIASSIVFIIIVVSIVVCCCNQNCWCYQRYRGGGVIVAPAPATTVTVVNSSSQMVPQPYPVANPQLPPPQGYAQSGYSHPPPAQGYAQGYAQPPQPIQGYSQPPPEYSTKGYARFS